MQQWKFSLYDLEGQSHKKHVTLNSQCNCEGDPVRDIVKRMAKSTTNQGHFEEKCIYRPPSVVFYNYTTYMGGVDLHDQNRR